MVEDGEVMQGLLVGEAARPQLGEQRLGEGNLHSGVLQPDLLVNHRIQVGDISVIDLVEEHPLHDFGVALRELRKGCPLRLV